MTALRATCALFLLELRQALRRKSLAFLVLLVLLPVVLPVVVLRRFPVLVSEGTTADAWFLLYTHLSLASVVLPLLALLQATSVYRVHVEQGTLPYLVLAPLPRSLSYLVQWAASALLVIGLAETGLGATLLAWRVATPAETAGNLLAVSQDAALALAVGGLAYTALFALLGVSVKRPLVVGIVYGVFLEIIVPLLPVVAREVTVTFNLRCIQVSRLTTRGLLEELGRTRLLDYVGTSTGGEAVAHVALVAGAALLAGAIIVARRQFSALTAD